MNEIVSQNLFPVSHVFLRNSLVAYVGETDVVGVGTRLNDSWPFSASSFWRLRLVYCPGSKSDLRNCTTFSWIDQSSEILIRIPVGFHAHYLHIQRHISRSLVYHLENLDQQAFPRYQTIPQSTKLCLISTGISRRFCGLWHKPLYVYTCSFINLMSYLQHNVPEPRLWKNDNFEEKINWWLVFNGNMTFHTVGIDAAWKGWI